MGCSVCLFHVRQCSIAALAKSQEALAKARETKKAQKAQVDTFMEKLAQSGKTIEKLIAELAK